MKQAYTTFSLGLRKLLAKDQTLDDLIDYWEQKYGAAYSAREAGWENHYLVFHSFCILKEISESRATHIFLPGAEFVNWIISCVKDLLPEYADAVRVLGDDNRVVVFHFPCNSGFVSFGANIGKDNWEPFTERTMPKSSAGVLVWSAGNGKQLGRSIFTMQNASQHRPDVFRYIKLLIGLGMYISAFPETLKDGPPLDLQHPSHHKYIEPKWIGISEKISLGGTHASPVAHFRHGHFRVLTSERFTKKRFQAVFVSETFVNKAKAKTVLAPEEVDQKA